MRRVGLRVKARAKKNLVQPSLQLGVTRRDFRVIPVFGKRFAQIVIGLQPEPSLSLEAKVPLETQCRVGSHATSLADDVRDAVARNAYHPRQSIGGHAERRQEFFTQDRARVCANANLRHAGSFQGSLPR